MWTCASYSTFWEESLRHPCHQVVERQRSVLHLLGISSTLLCPWSRYREQHVCSMWFLMAPEGSWCPKGRKGLIARLLSSVGMKQQSRWFIHRHCSQTFGRFTGWYGLWYRLWYRLGKCILSRISLLTNKVRLVLKWIPVKINFMKYRINTDSIFCFFW